MHIEITALLESDQFALSHSQAEGGQSAGRDTWNASLEAATETVLLDSPEKIQAMREFARSSGGWTEDECNEWTDQEVNALFLQWIAGDCRQCPAILPGVTFEARESEEARWEGPRDENGALLSSDGNRFIDAGTVEWFYSTEDEPDMETGPFDSRSDAYHDAAPARKPRADSLEGIDWEETEVQQSAGRISGNLYGSTGGPVYFTLDS